MKAPSTRDRFVAVTAYLTDEAFGYDYWAARQFASREANGTDHTPAVLVLCRDKDEQLAALTYLRERLLEKEGVIG